MRTIVAFDDSGSPGISTPSNWLADNRKSYVATILLPEQVQQLTDIMLAGVELIRKTWGIEEFHLTDIMNGKGQWSVMPQEDRFATFEVMCDVFSSHYIPCVSQTWDKSFYERNGIDPNSIGELEHLDKLNYEHVAFYLTLKKSLTYIADNGLAGDIDFYCDEGIRNAGSSLKFSFLTQFTPRDFIQFEESKSNIYLQIADFAAYCFNKSQMLAVKKNKTETDWKILNCIDKSGFDFLDTIQVSAKKEQIDAELYDYVLWQNHQEVHRK
ncbi:DUF3800 domain-containing protein [Vibrio parahaemolyticus]|uniref:DUF3800 domain-containing protein n=1 Tax=Shewanella algae TaxID=38313 RepID=UPI0031F523A3|nr:DUF3800 domain-containing protein [Vibrio parahaemolyticus]HCM0830577.1 DUF3800 domain-containing protein [Vibrio parahaemolyticus]